MLPEALPLAFQAFLQLQLVSATCGEAFFEPSTFETLESVSGASTVAKIDYWQQTNEMDMHAAYVLNMSEVSASYCWSQGQR
jgi:hypothetical protein